MCDCVFKETVEKKTVELMGEGLIPSMLPGTISITQGLATS